MIGFSGPFDGVWRERVYGISRTALGGLGRGELTVSGIRAENDLWKAGSKLLIPRYRPLAPSFVLVGRRPMDRSLTVAARKRSRLGNGRGSETVAARKRSRLGNGFGTRIAQTFSTLCKPVLDSAAGPEISVRSALDAPKPITGSPVIDSPKVLRTLDLRAAK